MNLTPIRELVQKTRQIDPKKLGVDSFTYVDISSIDKDTKKIVEPQTLSIGDVPSRARKEIKVNDVLVATVRPNLNGVAIVPVQYDNQIASTGFCVLRSDTEQLDPNYLFYFTQTDSFISHLTELSTGAGYPAVSDEDILDTRIPLPPLTEQKRIASLLARADRLRQLRRTAHDLGESLLQSVFLEMFGDIARNEKGWEKYPISKYINVQGGYSFKSGDFIKAGVKVVKITNVHYGQLSLQDDTEFLPVEHLNKYSAFSLKTGDIVMSLTRPIIKSLNSVKVCRVQETDLPCLLNQRVGRLIIKNTQKIVSEFLLHFCYSQHFKAKVDDFLSESLQPNISINQVGEIEIPVPPLSLQEEFAGVVARVESLRGRMSEAGRQVKGLFESLLSQSFDGGQ